jgi:hypothetical protein
MPPTLLQTSQLDSKIKSGSCSFVDILGIIILFLSAKLAIIPSIADNDGRKTRKRANGKCYSTLAERISRASRKEGCAMAIDRWRDAFVLLEDAVEVGHAVETCLKTDIGDRACGVAHEHDAGCIDAVVVEIADEAVASTFLEEGTEGRLAHAHVA